jgi:hypothetical protein
MTRTRWSLVGLGVAVVLGAAGKAKKRARRAREAYHRRVSAGSRPIEAVGTAVAVFVGIDQR